MCFPRCLEFGVKLKSCFHLFPLICIYIYINCRSGFVFGWVCFPWHVLRVGFLVLPQCWPRLFYLVFNMCCCHSPLIIE